MDMDITKIGERGQVVIPLDMRKGLVKGEKLVIVKEKDKFILEPIKKMKARNIEEIREDLDDIKAADRAWEEIRRGEYIEQDVDEFLKELREWAKE